MAQAKPQFTPEQILEAGRRAEAQGQLDYAIQFYRHLTDHHANAPQTQAAREALARLGQGRAPAPADGRAPAKAQLAASVRPYRNGASQPLGAATTPEGPTLGSIPGGGAPSQPPAPGPALSRIDLRLAPAPEAATGARFDMRREAGPRPPAPGPAAATTTAQQVPPAAAFHPVELPHPVRGYRTSRFFAGVVTATGLLQLVAGVVLTAAWLAAMLRLGGAEQVPGFLIAAGPYSIGLVFTGAVTIVMGQALKAIFDTANASRELVAIARAVASGGHDEH